MLGNKFGGMVSPALKPIVLRMVYQAAKQVSIPIIGIGGVTKAEDGGIGGKDLWRPAALGLRPTYSGENMKKFLKGGFVDNA